MGYTRIVQPIGLRVASQFSTQRQERTTELAGAYPQAQFFVLPAINLHTFFGLQLWVHSLCHSRNLSVGEGVALQI
ncbi:MAG: hypothetical protein VB140_05380 [Burkholderia sp.]